jgi:hypothetical protein
MLLTRETTPGPGGRAGLDHVLVTDTQTIPVYNGEIASTLTAHANRSVIITGKLVDLGGEGFGQELWVPSAHAIHEMPAR